MTEINSSPFNNSIGYLANFSFNSSIIFSYKATFFSDSKNFLFSSFVFLVDDNSLILLVSLFLLLNFFLYFPSIKNKKLKKL